jgi:hypothetical protein
MTKNAPDRWNLSSFKIISSRSGLAVVIRAAAKAVQTATAAA